MRSARTSSRVFAALVFLISLSLSPWTAAQGPGLANLTYTSAELFKPLSIIRSQAGSTTRGHGNVAMHDGYLVVIYAQDGGKAGGGFSFYDISNPRAPVRVSKRDFSAISEPHGFGFSNSYPGHYAVVPSIRGILFWDWTNVNSPVLLTDMTLPGVVASPYDLAAWWVFWQAPYVYVGGSRNGLYIVDATDTRNPRFVKRVPPSLWGNFRVGPTFAVGNLLVMSSMDRRGYVTMDISDPENPQLLRAVSTGPAVYSTLVNGNRLLAAGNDGFLYVNNISDPTQITQTLKSAHMSGGKGGYLSVQDSFAHVGASARYAKVNLSTGAIAGTGSSGIAGRDEDFATVLGNLVFIGSDHSGSAIVPHQSARDTTGPTVNMVSPKNNATNQARTSRVGITLTDAVDLRTVKFSTFTVRPVGGSALPGKYSAQMGIVNFFPDQLLAPGTTYEVRVTAGGMKDWAGNGVPTALTSRFTTAE